MRDLLVDIGKGLAVLGLLFTVGLVMVWAALTLTRGPHPGLNQSVASTLTLLTVVMASGALLYLMRAKRR